LRRPNEDQWWRQNVDLPRYYSYRSILECIHHYDIYAGKNYFYYHNSRSGFWSVLPWDLDLSWANNMHGTGQEPFYLTGVLRQPPFQIEYQNRLREIRDLLFSPEQMDALIDEYAAFIGNRSGGLSFADADRAKWDYHPIMASPHASKSKAKQGEFYKISPTGDFRGMVQLMKDYVRTRGQWVDETLLDQQQLPPTPTIATHDFVAENTLHFQGSLPQGGGNFVWRWRLAEVASPADLEKRVAHKYEIIPLWQTNGNSNIQVPAKVIEPGHTYRVRAALKDDVGRSSHWSAPVELTAPTK